MEYIPTSASNPDQDTHKILCCHCGVAITPNPSNSCAACLRTKVDITQDIPKQVVIYFCRFCERYLNPPNQWVACTLESRELMTLCLKRLKGLNKVRLVDASFLWTEPHSRRIKIKLTVQGELSSGVVLEQSFLVEYTVNHQMCDDCRRVEANDTWNASVQVRQKNTSQRKTILYLEQLLMKYQATKECTGVKVEHEGLDFFFGNESGAKKLVEFMQSVIPIRYQHAKKLISHDANSNLYNYKYTFSVEVVPICKDNIVCLPQKLAHSLGGIGQLCIVQKVTHLLHLIDPNTCQFAELNASTFFKMPFNSLILPRQLVEFTVINIEPIRDHERRKFAGQGAISSKHVLADVWVQKSSELGITEDTIHCRSHLGHLLNPGDSVLGLDMNSCNANDQYLEKMPQDKIPDVILVKKFYAEKALRNRKRRFRLKHLNDQMEVDIGSTAGSIGQDYNDFLEDLEEDAELRQNVNMYKDSRKIGRSQESEGSETGDIPQVKLAELLDDMTINDVEMAE